MFVLHIRPSVSGHNKRHQGANGYQIYKRLRLLCCVKQTQGLLLCTTSWTTVHTIKHAYIARQGIWDLYTQAILHFTAFPAACLQSQTIKDHVSPGHKCNHNPPARVRVWGTGRCQGSSCGHAMDSSPVGPSSCLQMPPASVAGHHYPQEVLHPRYFLEYKTIPSFETLHPSA